MLTFEVKPEALGLMLRGLLGSAPVPEKPEEIMRWEDDGGPLNNDYEPWDHIFTAGPPDPHYWDDEDL